MRLASCAALLALAACGGGGGDGGFSVNSFTGTLNVAAGTPSGTCVTTHPLTISATGITPDVVNAIVGDCVRFTTSDAGAHQVAAREATGCAELNGPPLAGVGQSFTTAPLAAPKVCHWQDLENQPAGGGGY
jgi:plastocyanin